MSISITFAIVLVIIERPGIKRHKPQSPLNVEYCSCVVANQKKKGVENEFACAPFKVGQVDLERIIYFFFFTLV